MKKYYLMEKRGGHIKDAAFSPFIDNPHSGVTAEQSIINYLRPSRVNESIKPKNILQQIKQARLIATNCRERIDTLNRLVTTLRVPQNLKGQLKYFHKKDEIQLEIQRLEKRADNVWDAVISYQGKYINWRDIHIVNGKKYHGIIELIDGSINDLN